MEATYNSTSPVEEIAGLRQYRGLTVRALQPHGRRSKFTPRGRSKQICRSRVSHHSKNMTSARQAKQSSYRGDWVTEDQLPSKLIQTNSCDDAVTRSDDLHYYNCFKKQSLLSLLSLPRLSSGSCKSRPLMLSTSRPRMTTLTILIVLLLSQLSFCLAGITYDAKHPLTRTDGSSNVYRTFTGDGPVGSTHIARYGNSVSPRSFLPDTTSSDSGPLDFQTMRVIPGWGPHNTDVLLVSGRDYIYMLNATGSTKDGEIRYIQRLQWKSPNATQKSCQRMGKDESECNNFIRVVERWDDNRLYVCGTNSYEPTCRFYSRDDFNAPANKNSLVFEEASCNPRCVVPYNPNTASASLYTRTSNEFQLFSAVINDFMGKKPVLMRKSDPYVYSMDKWFNDPTFIKMVEYKDGKVYLFFRETATSVETGTDESVTYARVAQVCKNDIGGLSILPGQWTTFLKARLKCSSNANKGFVFNNLTSVSNITTITNQYGSMDVIFATFTTPWEWNTVSTSAVCVFSMDTIRTTFEGNFLKDQEYRPISNMEDHHPSENIIKAVPIPDMEVPRPRPGRCLNDSSLMTDDSLSFAKTYFLMYEPVNPLYEKAMFVSETDVRATQIAIDTNAGDNNELLVYVGTEEGKVLRLRPRLNETTGPKSILLEEMQIANKSKCDNGEISCGILALHISRPELDQRVENNLLHPDEEQIVPAVFVAFTDRMTQVPLTSCKQYANERCCNADPECGWYREQRCVVRTPFVSLSAVSSLSEIPTDCQLPSSETTCTCDCADERNGARQPTGCGGRPLGKQAPHQESSITNLIDEPQYANHNQDSLPNKKQPGSSANGKITDLFVERVLPSISEEFQSFVNSLESNEEQQRAFLEQLQKTLRDTAETVMKNFKEESCLPAKSINSIVHAYPLLLREVEIWHETALKKMDPEILPNDCWRSNRADPCVHKIAFGVPLAPTLWKPLTRLLQSFGATCDNSNDDELVETTLCEPAIQQPETCDFTEYPVDVKAFFRSANDTRKFMPASRGPEPLWKPFNKTLSDTEAIRGHVGVMVKGGKPFRIQYSAGAEKVKINFHYAAEFDCSLNEPNCAGHMHGCIPSIERTVKRWFSSATKQLTATGKRCQQQLTRFHKDIRPRRNQQQMRHRRSYNNNLLRMPQRCRYIKKRVAKISEQQWNHVISRAEQRGGRYFESHDRVEFYSRGHVRNFFNNECSISQRDLVFQNLGRVLQKRSRPTKVAILSTPELPFAIERKPLSGKVFLRYFSQIVSSFDTMS
ncbi:uncharacterized protein LOC143445033 isoform X1 [Clavelina lepadiformis]|uniref:uncharacterized protein LOC143445033 isoform X1 n=1 Tax=Clavelina lepadiformis TaxID=159417 RepID=UPI004042A6FC